MRGGGARVLALAAGLIAAAFLPAAGGAGSGSGLQQRADSLRATDSTLVAKSTSAVVGLYALDSELHAAQTQLQRVSAQADAVARRRAQVRSQVAVARRAAAFSERQLALRLHDLYEQGDAEPLAVLLGASSLDDAVAQLDDLNRAASENIAVLRQARAARHSLGRLAAKLAARDAQLRRLQADAAATTARLAGARSERVHYLAALARQRALNRHEIAALESQANAIEARARQVAAARATAPTTPTATASATASVPTASGARTLTVTATGYSMQGTTATGAPVGYGIVAVDPSVIPLGTRLSIPGYGSGVAADTGAAVTGATIDLWFPTRAQALAWGRRVVTIGIG